MPSTSFELVDVKFLLMHKNIIMLKIFSKKSHLKVGGGLSWPSKRSQPGHLISHLLSKVVLTLWTSKWVSASAFGGVRLREGKIVEF